MGTRMETSAHDLRTHHRPRHLRAMRHLVDGPGAADTWAVAAAISVGVVAVAWALAPHLAAWMNWG